MNKIWASLCLLLAILMIAPPAAAAAQSTFQIKDPQPHRTFFPLIPQLNGAPTPIPTPQTAVTHAVALHYQDYQRSRSEVSAFEQKMQAANVNMVALCAGRVEWTYFKWNGHESSWANDVKDTGIDFLSDDSQRYGKWAHIDAIIDTLAPGYIKAHPEQAAVTFDGRTNPNLVGTMDLVEGPFGQMLLDMVEYIAANYPEVDSISITELSYHIDGYSAKDKAAYLKYSGAKDWPRQTNGQIDINDTTLGNWRSSVLDKYLDKAVAAAHRHGKKFFMDVQLNPERLQYAANEYGTRYSLVLEHTDQLVLWGYFDLDNYAPEDFTEIAKSLAQYGNDRLILSIGLWGPNDTTTTADKLKRAILASQAGGLDNIWVTPSTMMTAEHWQVLNEVWK
jgi:hypothetical protein